MNNSSSIESLIRASKQEKTAEAELLASYRCYLRFLARMQISRTLTVKADASDLVQETMLYAHRCFKQFRGSTEQELLAWLRTILQSRIVELVRRHTATKRDHRLEEQLYHVLEGSAAQLNRSMPTNLNTPSQQAIQRESGVLLANALEELSDDYREVITLHHVDGLKFAQVAERMNRSESATQRLWIRALAKLREVLKHDE
jgi:RNA polymerase sigma-70 factor (ECF subfamily)